MKLKVFYEKIYGKFYSVSLFRKIMDVPFIKKLLDYEVISYLVFGVLTTVVNFLTYFAMGAVLGEGYETKVLFNAFGYDVKWLLIVNAVAWIMAVLFAFVTNKLFVFESPSWKAGTVLRELVSFVGARIISFLVFEELIFMLLIDACHIHHIVSKVLVSVLVIIFNYVASKLVIFRKKGENK